MRNTQLGKNQLECQTCPYIAAIENPVVSTMLSDLGRELREKSAKEDEPFVKIERSCPDCGHGFAMAYEITDWKFFKCNACEKVSRERTEDI